jgi:hypothetical protein
MPLRTLYNPKPPIWPLIGLPDLAGDPQHMELKLVGSIHKNNAHALFTVIQQHPVFAVTMKPLVDENEQTCRSDGIKIQITQYCW